MRGSRIVAEARACAGGRATSQDVLGTGTPIDLGAQWLHCACDKNPMVQLALSIGYELLEDSDGCVKLFDERAGC